MPGKYPDKPKLQDGWHDVRIERLFEYEKNGTQGVGVVMENNLGHEGVLFVRNHSARRNGPTRSGAACLPQWGRKVRSLAQTATSRSRLSTVRLFESRSMRASQD
mgnify:CR=1 FL=1